MQLYLLINLLPGSPAASLPAFTFWVGKTRAFYTFIGKNDSRIWSGCFRGDYTCPFFIFLMHAKSRPLCRFLSMPWLVWNKPIYLGRQGSSHEGLWTSHSGLPPELSCSPGSSSSMLITTFSNCGKFMRYTKVLEPHIHQARLEHVPIGCFITTKNGSFDSPFRSAHWGFIRSRDFLNTHSSCWATYRDLVV